MKRQAAIQAATAAVLEVLVAHRGDGLFTSQVAERARLEMNVVSPILKRLADDGWALQAPDPTETYPSPDGPQPRIRYRLEPQRGRLWAEQRLLLAQVTNVRPAARRRTRPVRAVATAR